MIVGLDSSRRSAATAIGDEGPLVALEEHFHLASFLRHSLHVRAVVTGRRARDSFHAAVASGKGDFDASAVNRIERTAEGYQPFPRFETNPRARSAAAMVG